MTPVLITFEAHGFPVELSSGRDIARAVATRQLSRDTIVRVHAAGRAVEALRARHVPQLQPFLGIDPSSIVEEVPPPPPPKVPPPPPPPQVPPPPPHASPAGQATAPARGGHQTLRKGQNLAVAATGARAWRLELVAASGGGRSATDVDFSAFVLRGGGKVGGDDDLVFYNNRCGADGAVVLLERAPDAAAAASDTFRIDMAALGADVRSVIVTASLYGTDRPGGLDRVSIELVDPAANVVIACYAHDEQATETALILAELYRHGDGWKFRAVGQGYAAGFRALVERYGVDVGADD